jgi:3-phenylpropionate/trans-cinnamate dioxygenase ferredoxin subunit
LWTEDLVRFVRVCGVGEVSEGEMKAVEVDGEAVLLCKVEGELYAVHDECTHECFPLSEGTLDGHCVTCLLHGARFDVRSGEVLALPAYGAVKTYAVKVEGDDVLVAVE